MSHYLAWGGEQGEEPALLTLDEIAHGLRHGHYSGDEPHAHLARVEVADDEATLTPVDLRTREHAVDGDDYIHIAVDLVDGDGAVLDTVELTVDGRA